MYLQPLMKTTLMTLLFTALVAGGWAQKFAYIDSDYVLLHIPEYAEAQQTLNQLAIDWQAEIEAKMQAVERLELAYRAERVLLTPEMRAKREQDITAKREEARALQREKFGVEGELFRQRQELIQPIQDLIFEELKEIASGSSYMVIFDKSNQSNMLYTNPKYDISDRLIKALGFVPGETIEAEEPDKEGGESLRDKARGAVDGATDAVRGAAGGAVQGARGGIAPSNSRDKN